jgi:hypothetical protein
MKMIMSGRDALGACECAPAPRYADDMTPANAV